MIAFISNIGYFTCTSWKNLFIGASVVQLRRTYRDLRTSCNIARPASCMLPNSACVYTPKNSFLSTQIVSESSQSIVAAHFAKSCHIEVHLQPTMLTYLCGLRRNPYRGLSSTVGLTR